MGCVSESREDSKVVELIVRSILDTNRLPVFDDYVCSCSGMWRVDGDNYVVTIPGVVAPGLSTMDGVEVIA